MLSVLRNLGIDTIVVAGSCSTSRYRVVVDAVNAGFSAVVATDAVAGTPPEYGEAVLRHTIAMLATLTTVDGLTAAWATP